MRESVIVKNILAYLNGLPECVAEKIQGNSIASGRADINACYRGFCLRIEVKTADHGNKASARQKANLKRWEMAGAYTAVVYSVEEVKKLIEKVDKNVR